ncbi:MAG: glycosyltransferase family 2 protein [Saprospiraceae bacterium]|nr:glycosyltransferase family 2 protein [Candidatus Vicinibacter affinis]MBK7695185.1 glycosyltransferase family 2 protein [Candidatus Vicinibacter affinis]MBK8404266.1 glycosyltransferase family 2 protein [Candidatus Vicinibacter affinis]MBK9639988.1 glycosyltransferase family 2 protein [Candidatus Vicinibacter affinis]HQX44906.1 glycosyltransferase family 2 protein [Saprospiraceae bacterium]
MISSTPLSAVVICFNEEEIISSCLNALLRVADEIVVLDSFSTDKTPEICRSKGVRFYQQKFIDYGSQKQDAVKLCRFDHILSVDADEILDEELVAAILGEKQKGLASCYILNRKTYYCGQWIRHCGWYPDLKIRLWHKAHAHWNQNKLHEVVDLIDPNAKPLKLNGHIDHYSYRTVSDHVFQLENFANLFAEDYFAKGIKSSFSKKFFSPVWKFFKMYIFKAGVLDGKYGFLICKRSAYGVYLKYKRLELLQLTKKQKLS